MYTVSTAPGLDDDLRAQVAEGLLAATSSADLLPLLARFSPGSAAGLLLGDAGARAEIASSVIAAAVDEMVRADLRSGGGTFAEPIAQVVRAHWRVLLPDTITAVLSAGAFEDEAGELAKEALARFRNHAELLRFAAQHAAAHGDASAHDLLTRLGRADPSLATVSLVHRLRGELPSKDGVSVKVALLSSFTVDPLLPYVDLELHTLGFSPSLYLAPFNSWTTEMLAPESGLRRFKPDVSFLSVSVDDLVPELAGAVSAGDLAAAGDRVIERVMAAVEGYFSWNDGLLVVHSMYSAYRDPMGILAGREQPSRRQWLAELNDRVARAVAPYSRCYILDMEDVLTRRNAGAIDNPKLRYLASMRLGEQSLTDVASAYVRYIAPLKGLAKKCVVLDLDNTLWGGVVGEDGPHGIKLGHTAPGIEYQDFQRYLQSLMKRGVLLAIASKNNPDDALEVIRSHQEMVLREPDFAAVRINWRPKPESVAALAEELNIGLDSFVFVDDNPDERELMRQLLPQVLTVELPRDPARYRETLEALPHLQSLAVTKEDLARTESYRANREREHVKVTAESLEAYLASLKIVVDIEEATESTLPRVHQLFHRTNQFNVTTRRYDAGQLATFAADPSAHLLVARAGDKFGDHGLVAIALARIEGNRCVIDSFLMSCRVIGYGVETTLLAEICERARAAGATRVEGDFIPTKKNPPARDFYERHGFDGTALPNEVVHWQRSLADGGPVVPSFVQVRRSAS